MPCGASLEIGWIPVRRTVDRDEDVEASDHVDIHVRLLPILEDKAQDAILEDELAKRGWTKEADGAMTKSFGGVVARLPAGGRTVRIEVKAETAITASATVEGRAKEEDLEAQEAIGRQAAAAAERKLKARREDALADLVRENIGRLEGVREEVEREVNEVTVAATRRSLVQRAAEIGSIESAVESRGAEGGYELRITVKT
jgi:hypothetical protein